MIVSVIALAVSGIVLSQHLYQFLKISKGASIARSVHLVCAYLNYILMSLHLGLHWNTMIGAMRKNCEEETAVSKWIPRLLAAGIAGYGIYALFRRQIGEYFFLRTHFVFFDDSEPLNFFFVDYLAIIGLFVFIGHYLAGWLKRLDKKGHSK